MAPKLSDFDDPEWEYQRVCGLVNRLVQLHEHTTSKNARLRALLVLRNKQRDELLDVINHIVNEVKLTSSQYELCRQAIASAKGESK